MGLGVLLRLLASLQILPHLVSPQVPPVAPSLSLNPLHTVYLPGETVTLTCSVPHSAHLGRKFQFSRDGGRRVSSGSSNTHTLIITGPGDSGSYTCAYWIHPFQMEDPIHPFLRSFRSQESQPVSISVTDLPSQPGLSVDSPAGVVNEGQPLIITCVVLGDAGEQRFHFYKDGAEILRGDSEFQITSTDPGITSVLSILKASPNNTGEYTCRYRKNVSGRWVLSLGSRAVNVTVTGINTARSYLWVRDLAVGGYFFLINDLIFLVTHWCF